MPEEQFSQESTPKPGAEKITGPEIGELRKRVEKLESGWQKEALPEKKEQIVKQEIKNYLQDFQQASASPLPLASRDEADEISKFSASQQVGALVSLVFEKGLSEAVAVARTLDNPAILDEFHDLLVDKYYEELVKRKILKFL